MKRFFKILKWFWLFLVVLIFGYFVYSCAGILHSNFELTNVVNCKYASKDENHYVYINTQKEIEIVIKDKNIDLTIKDYVIEDNVFILEINELITIEYIVLDNDTLFTDFGNCYLYKI